MAPIVLVLPVRDMVVVVQNAFVPALLVTRRTRRSPHRC
jgi:multiple sugar transport system permease protein